MNPTEREQVKELLSRAAQLPADQRAAFITLAAVGAHGVASEAIELLKTLDDAAFMSAPTGAGLTSAVSTQRQSERPGQRIDRYKLLEKIGEGGFGVVFMAEQTEPVVRRVALKIIKSGMDTKQVIARFEAERQALALMDHPNIAHVLDAGATESGGPYFVMELVRGEPVTAYCDGEQLGIRQRLGLFCDICSAVQHAHQKGVIHRDIKPGNVLVTVSDGRPIPKVIDFGIAKATEFRLTEKTLFTGLHQLIGTPEYMSPEQAEFNSADIDTRSDVYSLGVLLYELLTGTTPFDGRKLIESGYDGLMRTLREVEPPRPSFRLATMSASGTSRPRKSKPSSEASLASSAIEIARRRHSEPLMLTRAVRGELDWIVMRALEKDRSRRYDSPGNLAADVERYLAGEPVEAAPPSVGYRFRKTVRRHRFGVTAAGFVALALLVGLGAAVWQASVAARERDAAKLSAARAVAASNDAEARRRETAQLADFQAAQLKGIDPERMGKRLLESMLADDAAGMKRRGVSEAGIAERKAQLTQMLADVNPTNVALQALDENIFAGALEAAGRQFKDQPTLKADLLQNLSDTMDVLGLSDRALTAGAEALSIRRRVLGNDNPETLISLNNMGLMLVNRRSRPAEAETYLREALATRSRLMGPEDRDTLATLSGLGVALLMQGKRDEAKQCFRDLLERYERAIGPDDPDTLMAMNNVGGLWVEDGRAAEAEPYFRQVLERRRRVLGEDDLETLLSMNNLAVDLEKQERPADAEPLYREALERSRRARGEDHYDTLLYMSNLGFVLNTMGKLAEAEQHTREAFERRRRLLGDDHGDTLQSMHNLGVVLQSRGKLDEAESLLRDALARRIRSLGADHPSTLQSLRSLGVVQRARGKLDEAEHVLRDVLERRRRTLGKEHPDTLDSLVDLGSLLAARDMFADAEPLLREAVAGRERTFGKDSPMIAEARAELGAALTGLGRYDEAENLLLEAERGHAVAHSDRQRSHTTCVKALVSLYERWNAAEPGHDHAAQAERWRNP